MTMLTDEMIRSKWKIQPYDKYGKADIIGFAREIENIVVETENTKWLFVLDGLSTELEKNRTNDMSYDLEMQLNIAIETLKELRLIMFD